MERYFIGNDESGHTYVVPLAKQAEWNAWRDLPEDDEASWDAPEWAERIEGGVLSFTNPQMDGVDIMAGA